MMSVPQNTAVAQIHRLAARNGRGAVARRSKARLSSLRLSSDPHVKHPPHNNQHIKRRTQHPTRSPSSSSGPEPWPRREPPPPAPRSGAAPQGSRARLTSPSAGDEAHDFGRHFAAVGCGASPGGEVFFWGGGGKEVVERRRQVEAASVFPESMSICRISSRLVHPLKGRIRVLP